MTEGVDVILDRLAADENRVLTESELTLRDALDMIKILTNEVKTIKEQMRSLTLEKLMKIHNEQKGFGPGLVDVVGLIQDKRKSLLPVNRIKRKALAKKTGHKARSRR